LQVARQPQRTGLLTRFRENLNPDLARSRKSRANLHTLQRKTNSLWLDLKPKKKAACSFYYSDEKKQRWHFEMRN